MATYDGNPATFPVGIGLVDDGIAPVAAQYNPGLEGLSDRTAWLYDKTGYTVLSNTAFQQVTDAVPGAGTNFATWTPGVIGAGATDAWNGPDTGNSTLITSMQVTAGDILDVTIHVGAGVLSPGVAGAVYAAVSPFVHVIPLSGSPSDLIVPGCASVIVASPAAGATRFRLAARGVVVAPATGTLAIQMRVWVNTTNPGAGTPNSVTLGGDYAVLVNKLKLTGRPAT